MIMMHTWFECKIRYEKVMENGMNKKVTESYLFDSLSFTERSYTGFLPTFTFETIFIITYL